jgi:hypothetical protein
MKTMQVKRLKDLEKENSRLKKAVAESATRFRPSTPLLESQACRKQDDRDRDFLFAQTAQNTEPIAPRHHYIQDNDTIGLAGRKVISIIAVIA